MPAYEKEVKALLQQLYSVKARAEAELNSCIAGAKAEYKALPESQQTQARKVSIVLARSGRLYAMQASYDKAVSLPRNHPSIRALFFSILYAKPPAASLSGTVGARKKVLRVVTGRFAGQEYSFAVSSAYIALFCAL